jgi:hypothetical protein
MGLPTFLVIGAQKAATTTLHHWFAEHPEVAMTQVKEANFLLDEGGWSKGLDWYEAQFAHAPDRPHRGDVSPAYTIFPAFRHAPERAAQVVPDARLVYVIREPVDRMVSAWAQLVGAGLEYRTLVQALRHEAHYTMASMYGLQLQRWLDHFDRSALLVVRLDDLADDPGPTFDAILEHVGLEAGWRPAQAASAWNTSERKSTVPGLVHRIGAGARAAGLPSVAWALTPNGRLGRRVARPLPRPELDPSFRADLRSLFARDFRDLRAIVGDEMDLWGLA